MHFPDGPPLNYFPPIKIGDRVVVIRHTDAETSYLYGNQGIFSSWEDENCNRGYVCLDNDPKCLHYFRYGFAGLHEIAPAGLYEIAPIDSLGAQKYGPPINIQPSKQTKYNSTCSNCGAPGDDLVFAFYCSNPNCRHYRI